MKWIVKLKALLAAVSTFLVAFGPFGLFAIAFLDSAFIPLPSGPDGVMLLLSAANHTMMPVYALSGILGSVLGCLVLYYIARKAGASALERFSVQKRERVKAWIDKYDVLSVLVASVLPPPFPFKLFVISAGVFRLSVIRFAIAVAVGRTFRFFLLGIVAVRFGAQAMSIIKHYYPYIGLGLAAVLVIGFMLPNLLKSKSGAAGPTVRVTQGPG